MSRGSRICEIPREYGGGSEEHLWKGNQLFKPNSSFGFAKSISLRK